MKRTMLTTLAMLCIYALHAQNLLIEVYSGANLTAYDSEFFSDSEMYVPIGFRIAGGLPNIQLGAEFNTDITHPEFSNTLLTETVTTEFSNRYYGGFIRGNISPNPAYGFGIILKAGVGVYDLKQTVIAEIGKTDTDFNTLGFNGGIGFSLPVGGSLHLEAGYMYNYVLHEENSGLEFKAPFHSFQLGFSYNGLFGQQAKRHKQNKRWKNGWRGAAGERYKNWKG